MASNFIRMPVRNPRKIRDWASADAFLGLKEDRPLPGRFTRLQRRISGDIAVKYHETDVVTYTRAGRIDLNAGGWHSLTTRSRWCEYVKKLSAYGDGNGQSSVIFQGERYTVQNCETLTIVPDPLLAELAETFGVD